MPATALEVLAGAPYHGFDEECLAPRGGGIPTRLELDSVRLVHADGGRERYVGLDETDYILPPEAFDNACQRFMRGDVWVYGELAVLNTSWLSEKGQRLLESKVRERDNEGSMPGTPRSRLTLGQLYVWLAGGGFAERPKIVVRFKRDMQARWLTVGDIERIVMNSENSGTFIIRGMERRCYGRSVNWLHRRQMFRLMQQLVKDANPQQPIERRTSKWFMDQYRVQILPMDRRRRIIGEPERTDNNISLDGPPMKERFLRHLSSAELMSTFAEQCEGLLATQISSHADSVQLFNVKDWMLFCRHARKNRLDAYERTGERWGLPPGINSPYDLVFDDDEFGMERFGGTREDWKKKLEGALRRQLKPKQQRVPSPLALSPPTSKKRKRAPQTNAIYDPDFSEPSTDGESDSEDDQSDPPEPSHLCLQTPRVLSGGRRMYCPHTGCYFSINPLEIFESRNFDPVKYASDVGVREEFFKACRAAMTAHSVEVHLPGIFVTREDGKILYRSRREPEESRYRRSGRLAEGKRPRIKREGD